MTQKPERNSEKQKWTNNQLEKERTCKVVTYEN